MAQPSPPPQHPNHDHSNFYDDRPETPISPVPSQSAFTTPPSARRSKHASTLSFAGEELHWSAAMSRPESAASDRISVVSGLTQHFPSNPLNVNPAPAYVAPAGAAQVVSEHRSTITGARLSDDEEESASPGKEDFTFSEPALALVNQFLDQLLYSFLSSARSTSMVALRPAVTEVLKHRLAREAIASAEEELAELLAGGDEEEEMDTRHKAAEHDRNWDCGLVWKRTRLRVMVYIRLGEMEDDDEQRYVREEELFQGSERRFSSSTGLVSWAAAIFLTSVLEYVAEQTLQVAGGAAHARVRRQARSAGVPRSAASTVVVEEHDVEKVALNSTLGRLWRTWRKSLRNYGNSGAATPIAGERSPFTPTSRENMYTAMSNRRGSYGTGHGGSVIAESARPSTAGSADPNDDSPELRYPEHVLAANIPLPLGDKTRDVHEIEVPGLAADPEMDERLHEILLSELALATHISLPVSKQDVHEIEVPGLARDAEDDDKSFNRHVERMTGSGLPLPMKDEKTDVDEIEIPGLAFDPDAPEETVPPAPARRNSFTQSRSPGWPADPPIPESSQPGSPVKHGRGMVRRSSSVPTPARTPMALEEEKIPVIPSSPPAAAGPVEKSSQGASEVQRKTSDQSSVYSQSEDAKKQDAGVVAGVAAGAAAAGTAVAAAVFGSKKDETSKDTSTQATHLDDDQLKGSNKTAAEIEELDKRKSLIDIKAIAGLQSSTPPADTGRDPPEVANAKRVEVRESGVAPTVVRTVSKEKARESAESYTLGNRPAPVQRQQSEEISSEEGPQDAEAIGVAQTADVPFTGVVNPSGMEQDARDSRRPTRLIIGDEPPDSPTIKQVRSSADAGNRPRSFSRKSEVSLTDQNRYVAQQIAQQQQRAVQQSPSGTATPRQLRSASVEQNGKQGYQDHPVVQRMASLKKSKPATDDQGHTLTSASIRGPEDFDMFVQGGETMKYTLTPEAVRDDSVSNSLVWALGIVLTAWQKKRAQQAQAQAQAGADRETPASPANSNAEALKQLTAGSGNDDRDSREGRSKSSKHATSASEDEEARKRQHRRSISRPATQNTRTQSKTGMMAREPRVQTESTRDFADFIRSTGPNKEASVYPLMNNVSTTSLNSLRSAHINGASASRSSSPAASRTHSLRNGAGGENVPPVPKIPPTTRGAMQPRGANGASPGNSDLIDFIRSGPDEPDKHRISRSVAPFRNTMDSEQFRDMPDRMSSDRTPDPTLNTYGSQQTMQSSKRTSVNSRSALLNGANSNTNNSNSSTAHPAYSGKPQTLASPAPSSQVSRQPSVLESEPTRKRYRNKDPYAIDFSDDEDDDLVTALPQNRGLRKEESLVDFLNSMEPPKETAGKPEPLINPNSAQAKKLIQNAKANGMNSSTRTLHGDGRARSSQNNPGPRPGYASSVNSARSNGSRAQPGGQQQFTSTSITASNAPRPKMVARVQEGRDQQSSTNDLASFLRDSGPPEDPESAPAPTVGRGKVAGAGAGAGGGGKGAKGGKEGGVKEKKSFFSFGRGRKKTYLDMP